MTYTVDQTITDIDPSALDDHDTLHELEQSILESLDGSPSGVTITSFDRRRLLAGRTAMLRSQSTETAVVYDVRYLLEKTSYSSVEELTSAFVAYITGPTYSVTLLSTLQNSTNPTVSAVTGSTVPVASPPAVTIVVNTAPPTAAPTNGAESGGGGGGSSKKSDDVFLPVAVTIGVFALILISAVIYVFRPHPPDKRYPPVSSSSARADDMEVNDVEITLGGNDDNVNGNM